MKAVVATFNQEKALVGAFSVITNLRMELFQALVTCQIAAAHSALISYLVIVVMAWPDLHTNYHLNKLFSATPGTGRGHASYSLRTWDMNNCQVSTDEASSVSGNLYGCLLDIVSPSHLTLHLTSCLMWCIGKYSKVTAKMFFRMKICRSSIDGNELHVQKLSLLFRTQIAGHYCHYVSIDVINYKIAHTNHL